MLYNGKLIKYPGADRVIIDIKYKPGMRNCYAHPKPWDGFGIHWTGGEGGPDALVRVLKANGDLSVHLNGATDGRLIQFADLNTQCAHIGGGNSRFVGIENTCRGFASKADFELAKKLDPTLRERDELDWSVPRDVYTDTIAGHTISMASFSPKQIENNVWAANALAATFNFPRQIPFREAVKEELDDPTPLGPKTMGDIAVLFNTKLYIPDFKTRDIRQTSKGLMKTWRGALGHFHIHKNKNDPGTQVLYALWADGWNPAQKTMNL